MLDSVRDANEIRLALADALSSNNLELVAQLARALLVAESAARRDLEKQLTHQKLSQRYRRAGA